MASSAKLRYCDSDCAASNQCGFVGGRLCPTCGKRYCPAEEEGDEDGNCEYCAERAREEASDGE